MKIVIDMNLTPSWAGVLEAGGHQTVHWSGVGSPKASDHDILLWARQRAYVVFPHDLDFGAISSPHSHSSPLISREERLFRSMRRPAEPGSCRSIDLYGSPVEGWPEGTCPPPHAGISSFGDWHLFLCGLIGPQRRLPAPLAARLAQHLERLRHGVRARGCDPETPLGRAPCDALPSVRSRVPRGAQVNERGDGGTSSSRRRPDRRGPSRRWMARGRPAPCRE